MPSISSLHGFDRVVSSTQTLTISYIKGLTSILQLHHVISIDLVPWPSVGALDAMIHPLTPTMCTGYDLGTPSLELWCVVDISLDLGW